MEKDLEITNKKTVKLLRAVCLAAGAAVLSAAGVCLYRKKRQ